jgi:hypothetical protein
MFVGKAKSLPWSGASERFSIKVGYPALPSNIRLGWKFMAGTTSLAYWTYL